MSYASSPPPSYNNVEGPPLHAPAFSASSNLSLEPLSISDPPTQVAAPPSANFPQSARGAGLTRSNSRPLPAVPPAIGQGPVISMNRSMELPSSDPFPPVPPQNSGNTLPPPQPRSGSDRTPSPLARRAVPVDEPFDSPAPSRPETLRAPSLASETPRFGGYGDRGGAQAAPNFEDIDDTLPDLPPSRPGNRSGFSPLPQRGVDRLRAQRPPSFESPPVNNNNNADRPARLNAVDVPRESLSMGWSATSPPPTQVQRNNAVHSNRSASEVAAPTPRVFYPPQPPPTTDRDRDNGPPNNRRRGNATSPTNLAFNDINNALTRRQPGPGQRDPPQRGTQRLSVNIQPALHEHDEWGVDTRPRGGAGSGRPSPSPIASTTSRGHSNETGSSFRASGSGWQPQRDDGPKYSDTPPPVPRKEYRKGFYRLYTPLGALFSVNPVFSNDLSLSSFDVEHVSPPRLAQNYIGYICQREHLKPSGVKLYLTTPQRGPELVTSMDMVIYMSRSDRHCGRDLNRPLLVVVEPGSELPGRRYPSPTTLKRLRDRDLDSDLPHAYYRLYGTSSQTPLFREDPSLATFFVDYVAPPLRAKDYIAYIADLEGIHPSRITLYLRSQPVGGDMIQEVEAEQIKDPDDFITRRTASETSDREPIMVTVELGADEYGDVDLNTKGIPLPISLKGMARSLSRTVSRVRKRESVIY
ncbi:hypothetical protein M407DRAFT_32939 [Tulasnella calospora MUT 4182]|uniref:Uncharacterized protein n=1 Tax=Tulasnella calospora MUT 4182 TaxID=1051891 RepID=A0A0C3PRV8_9AGAM|nr:hypothetical protein M407DRAFT_32939 [Tulasnella calospora MUT 4182]